MHKCVMENGHTERVLNLQSRSKTGFPENLEIAVALRTYLYKK